MSNMIVAVIIEPNNVPRPITIENDLLALNRAVNIDKHGNPHKDFEPFKIVEIKDGINIISSPKGEERSLPVTRTIGRYSKFYGIIYIVKMKGFELISMDTHEAIDYCVKFVDKNISLESLGLPSVDHPEDNDSRVFVDISCDDW